MSTLPTTELFDLFDWNSRNSIDINDLTQSPLEFAVEQGNITKTVNGLEFVSDSLNKIGPASTTTLKLNAVPVPKTFTLEFDISLIDIPENFNSTDNRIFIGGINYQGYTAGILISKIGIAVVNSPVATNLSLKLISGSHKYLYDSDFVLKDTLTFRLILNNTSKLLSIYIDDTTLIYDGISINTAHTLVNAVDPIPSSLGADQVLIAIRSLANKFKFILKSLRLSSIEITPKEKPVAVISTASSVYNIDSIIRFNANNSINKYGEDLEYKWVLKKKPVGSNVSLINDEEVKGVINLESGKTGNIITSETNLYDDDLVIHVVQGSDVYLSTKFLDFNIIEVKLASTGSLLSDLYLAINNPLNIGYDPDVASLFTIDMTEDEYIIEQTITISVDSYSEESDVYFLPDKTGFYEIELVVKEAGIYSDPVYYLVQVIETIQLLRHKPNSKFIFNYLSDFWNLVDNKEIMTTIWASAIQIVSGYLLDTLQAEANKSISTIKELEQKKWLHYSNELIIDSKFYDVISPRITGIFHIEANTNEFQELTNKFTINKPINNVYNEYACIIQGDSIQPCFIVNFEKDSEEGKLSESLIRNYEVLFESQFGYFTDTGILSVKNAILPTNSMDSTCRVLLTVNGSTLSFDASVSTETINAIVLADNTLTNDGTEYSFKLVKDYPDPILVIGPYIQTIQGISIESNYYSAYDCAEVELTNPVNEELLNMSVPLLANTENKIFFDWRNYLNEINLIGKLLLQEVNEPLDVNLNKIELNSVIHIRKTNNLPISDSIISIPVLGSTPDMNLYQNLDYEIKENKLHFYDLNSGKAFIHANSSIIYLEKELDELPLVINILGLESGSYRVIEAPSNLSLKVAHTFMLEGEVTFEIPKYNYLTGAPIKFWAELTYVDNSKAIEDNFGVLVGLPVEAIKNNTSKINYLQSVKALVIQYSAGPHIDNFKRTAQSLVGIPFADTSGRIIDHIVNTKSKQQVFTIKNNNDQTRRVITHSDYEVAINPRTGVKFQAYPYIKESEIEELSAEELTKYNNSLVKQGDNLFDVVRVVDYINDPELTDRFLIGKNILTKFHTFVILVPDTGDIDFNSLNLLREHIYNTKPAHVSFMLIGSKLLEEEIDVTDNLTHKIKLHICDSIYTVPFTYDEDYKHLIFPTEQNDFKGWNESDLIETFDCGYAAGKIDDYSGDGSWSETHQTTDFVNTFDSNVDVLNSYIWIPVTIDPDTIINSEFIIDEELELLDSDFEVVTGAIANTWILSPPLLKHVGSGVHPELPFGITSLQKNHPHTYFLIGFDNPTSDRNFGHEHRLRAVGALPGSVIEGPIEFYIRGKSSDCIAQITYFPNYDIARDSEDAEYEDHRWFFILEKICRFDLISPRVNLMLKATQYVPSDGLLIAEDDVFQGGEPFLEQETFRTFQDVQSQTKPLNLSIPADEQFVPSFGPGFWTHWDDLNADSGAGPVDFITYDYEDEGNLEGIGVSEFSTNTDVAPLMNVHIGINHLANKSIHGSHGFLTFKIPKPIIKIVTQDGLDVRVEGHYFIEEDPSADIGNGFFGDNNICGSRIFLIDSSTNDEYEMVTTFETGLNIGETVLGFDGAVQSSTGHVLTFTVDTMEVPAGTYHVALRHYYKFKYSTGGNYQYRIDESIYENGVIIPE